MQVRLLIICLLFAASFCQTSDDDIVTTIIPTYRHNWYSGYLNISNQKDIHYVFQESQNDRDNDPLILWVSSFPGCSSLFCMTYEIGAFQFLVPEEPSFNISKWAWNMKANLLFLETPGAGFSTGPTNTSDVQVTLDHLLALMQFYARFPTQKKNDLYLAGHGYAGILAPLLAKAIITRNQNPSYPKINFKGLLLGNPCTESHQCFIGGNVTKRSSYHYEYLYNHAFLTDKQWNQFKGACSAGYDTQTCVAKRDELDKAFDATNTTMSNIYAKCYKEVKKDIRISNIRMPNTGCDDVSGILTIMNEGDFQKAIHVTPGNFTMCNDEIARNYVGTPEGSYGIYKELIKAQKYKIVPYSIIQFVYSGDLSSNVPLVGTKTWISRIKEDIDIPVRRTWREWWVPGKHPHEDQVGGMVWELEGMTYATVKAAGYMVGKDQPQALFEIYDAFLSDKRLPLTSTVSHKSKQQPII